VIKRDGCCRFPGCERRRFVDAHHIRHWTPHEGPTQLDNLLTLCRHHHRLVHEGGWSIRGKPDEAMEFIRPDGRTYEPLRPRLRDEIRERILGARRDGVPSAIELCLRAAREAGHEPGAMGVARRSAGCAPAPAHRRQWHRWSRGPNEGGRQSPPIDWRSG